MIKRYDIDLDGCEFYSEDGEYVTYEDHAKEKQQLLDKLLYVKNNSNKFRYMPDKDVIEWTYRMEIK